MMDPSMTRYALNYLYFARDELPMWYYRKVSISSIETLTLKLKLYCDSIKLLVSDTLFTHAAPPPTTNVCFV